MWLYRDALLASAPILDVADLEHILIKLSRELLFSAPAPRSLVAVGLILVLYLFTKGQRHLIELCSMTGMRQHHVK